MRWTVFPLLLTLVAAASAAAYGATPADPELTIRASGQTVVFTRSQLLARPDVETVTIEHDPDYPDHPVVYQAVRATSLFAGLKIDDDAVIQFKCLDGFAAPISKERLLNNLPGRSLAYIAIEPAAKPWPPLKPAGGPSAGPFYLVWPKPEASFISPEEWPYQLAAFEVKGSLQSLYPKIFPDPKVAAASPVARGFAVFTKNCFACHTLNLSGAAEMGPDLNEPMNPTEYLTPAAFKTLVRNPQALRHFPRSRMSSFPPEVVSDVELDDLLAYLKHMATRKVQ